MKLSRRDFLRNAAVASFVGVTGCEMAPAYLGLYADGPDMSGPFVAPAGLTKDGISHVIDRLTFGARPGDYERVATMGVDAFIDEQLNPTGIDDSYCDWKTRRFQTLRQPTGELFEYREHLLLTDLMQATLTRAVHSKRQLYEVMVGFWTDHFNIDSSKGDCAWLKTADDREVIRAHALGNFGAMLRASAMSPAMLWYLDGRVNRVLDDSGKANENYARELLELHTLGVHGGYSQEDVMEVARCLSGWYVRSDEWFGRGRVEFKPEFHDNGAKRVLGHDIEAGLGEGDLDRVLEIVGAHPQTAAYISWKLCRRFISDDPSASSVQQVADTFMRSDGDIKAMLRTLFGTEAFMDGRNTKLKRPFRFVASALRVTGADTDAGQPVIEYLDRMGHSPFQYPTPDGYPEESSPWMSTMLWRWHFAAALAAGAIQGTESDFVALRNAFEDDGALYAQILGRRAQEHERSAADDAQTDIALLLASPDFQRY